MIGRPLDRCWSAGTDTAVLRAVDELHLTNDLGDETWEEFVAAIGEEGAVDLILIAGLVSRDLVCGPRTPAHAAARYAPSIRLMVTVIATYRSTPEAAQAVAELLAEHAARSEEEPGCRQFRAHRSLEDPTRFFLYETYDSDQAFAAHRRSKHFRQNIELTLAPLLIEREWHVCSEPLHVGPE